MGDWLMDNVMPFLLVACVLPIVLSLWVFTSALVYGMATDPAFFDTAPPCECVAEAP